MRRIELNALLRTLLESEKGVSDLHFSVGKAPQDEASGKLRCPFVQPPLPDMTPFMTEQVALNLIHDRPHLVHELLTKGSCDCAYSVPGLARFRVNIFSQRGSYSVVLRRGEPAEQFGTALIPQRLELIEVVVTKSYGPHGHGP